MKKYLFVIAITTVTIVSTAQSYYYEELGIDATEFMARFDSAVNANPNFGYTMVDSAILMAKLLAPEEQAKLLKLFEKIDPFRHISSHLEGGWEVAAISNDKEYHLIKPLKGDKYWVKQLTKTYNDVYYKSSLTLFKIDCEQGMFGVVQSTEYNRNGTASYSIPTTDDVLVDMNYATPDSIGEALVEAACKR